jgi:hypothetical protein
MRKSKYITITISCPIGSCRRTAWMGMSLANAGRSAHAERQHHEMLGKI